MSNYDLVDVDGSSKKQEQNIFNIRSFSPAADRCEFELFIKYLFAQNATRNQRNQGKI
jgi:hypothetical protein